MAGRPIGRELLRAGGRIPEGGPARWLASQVGTPPRSESLPRGHGRRDCGTRPAFSSGRDDLPNQSGPIDLGASVSPIDLAAELDGFIAKYPALVTAEGWPCCWQHYVRGSRNMKREEIRDMLRTYSAHAMLQAAPEDQRAWVADLKRVIGQTGGGA